jgi:fructan beta-fructosidase
MRLLTLLLSLAYAVNGFSGSSGNFYRPLVHFTAPSTWMNDPNGLVFYQGNYHLFYQDNPYGSTWGYMSWGHAISPDLVHWTDLPIAIMVNDERMVFSGSAVPDTLNTSGLCAEAEGCLVAIYTAYRTNFSDGHVEQDQCIAVSNDLPNAVTFVDYEANPVLAKNPPMSDFRDPKVFWYAPDSCWLMVVSDPLGHHIWIYSSPDLKEWTYLSAFGPMGATGGAWECPDLFELEVNGLKKWVLVVNINPGAILGGSGMQYFVGDFNGTHFVAEQDALWADAGKDFYAVASYNNVTDRRIWLGWMSNWQYGNMEPTMPWRTMQSIPREVSLRQLADKSFIVTQKIVGEFGKYATGKVALCTMGNGPALRISQLQRNLKKVYPGRAFYFSMDINVSACNSFELQIAKSFDGAESTGIGLSAGTRVYFDRTLSGNVSFSSDFPGKWVAELPEPQKSLHLEVLYDRTSVEVFWDHGALVMSNRIFPTASKQYMDIQKIGGVCGERAFSNVYLKRLDSQ